MLNFIGVIATLSFLGFAIFGFISWRKKTGNSKLSFIIAAISFVLMGIINVTNLINIILVISLLTFVVFLILGIVSLCKKTGNSKQNFIIAAISFIVCMIIAVNSPNNDKTVVEPKAKKVKAVAVVNISTTVPTQVNKDEETRAKAKTEAKKKSEEAKKKEEVTKVTAGPTFDFTWKQFKYNWKTLVPEVGNTTVGTITNVKTVDQKNDIAITAQASDNIGLIAEVQKNNNKVDYVGIMTQTSQDNSKNYDIIIALGNLIANSNSSLTLVERGNILTKGLGFSGNSFKHETYFYKGVEYKGDVDVNTGIITLSINPKK